ncbi:MAG: plastocyanin [Myxococcales bacterium]|nr:plastocyanin [Myxococcales bacterium]
MRMLIIPAAVSLAILTSGCGGDNNQDMAQPFDLASPTSVGADMAAAPGADLAAAPVDMATATAPTTAAITVMDNFYTPANVTIAAGGTVTWTFAGANPHTVTSGAGTPTGMFDSGIKSTGTFSFTFPTAGSVGYYCMVHGFAVMHGTVTVQ